MATVEEQAREWLDTQNECRRAIRDADPEVLAAFHAHMLTQAPAPSGKAAGREMEQRARDWPHEVNHGTFWTFDEVVAFARSELIRAPAPSGWRDAGVELPEDEDECVLVAVMNEAENHGTGEFEKFPEVARGMIYKHPLGITADTDCGEFSDEEILGWQPLPAATERKESK